MKNSEVFQVIVTKIGKYYIENCSFSLTTMQPFHILSCNFFMISWSEEIGIFVI